MTDRPLKRKYSRIERERRFHLNHLPPQINVEDFERLDDSYIKGTEVRLRRVSTPDGKHIVTKLGQKTNNPEQPDNVCHRMMTTLYMDEAQGIVFAQLPAHHSTKKRYKLVEQGWTFVIDVYEKPESVSGLIVAEVECDTDTQLASIECPSWCAREVTNEPEWSGAMFATNNRPDER